MTQQVNSCSQEGVSQVVDTVDGVEVPLYSYERGDRIQIGTATVSIEDGEYKIATDVFAAHWKDKIVVGGSFSLGMDSRVDLVTKQVAYRPFEVVYIPPPRIVK